MKRTIVDHHKNWHTQLSNALWADRVTPKVAIGNSPFFLVYGNEVILPPNLFLPSLQLSQFVQQEDIPAMTQRINVLLKLEEEHNKTKQIFSKHQSTIKKWFDAHKSTDREFEVGDLVLKWDKLNEKEGKLTKFRNLWLGPYQIKEKFGPG